MENKLCFWISLIFKDEILNIKHKQSIINKIRNSKIKGITTYWDAENLIILSTKEFNFILKILRYELHLHNYRLGLYYTNLGPDLVLVTI